MLFLPIIIMATVFAQDELALETYCFPSKEARIAVEKKLSSVIVPSDKVESENNCVTIQMRPHRRELLQNYAKRLNPDMFVQYSSEEIKREPCRLQIEKIRAGKKSNLSADVSLSPTLSTQSINETSQDIMDIVTLKDFSFKVDQDAIEGSCRFITEKLYEITLNVRRDPKPIVPPHLPAGTIVTIQTPPADQKTLSLTTSLQLKSGDRVELGSIVRELKKKNESINITPEVKNESLEETEEEKVFLSFQKN